MRTKPRCRPKSQLTKTIGHDLVEGDIAVSDQDIHSDKVSHAFVNVTNRLWLGGIIPYTFKELEFSFGYSKPLFSNNNKQLIERALWHIMENVPCLHFG